MEGGRWARWACAILLATAPAGTAAQIPQRLENLQVLSELSRDSVIQVMRSFSFALGVRCQYCHTGGDGISFEGVDFADDSDPDKVKAREMLRMVRDLNRVVLAALPERDSPPVDVRCGTCHRGRPRPISLADTLLAELDAFGPDSAAVVHDRLRDDPQVLIRGTFDFGEWELNVLAERLERAERWSDAIAIYALNGRRYPESVSIQLSLGALYERTGDRDAAMARYERVLELAPRNAQARGRLDALRGG